jgi:hypothetical protein
LFPHDAIESPEESATMCPTPEEMLATMIANLKEKTGKSLDDWLKIVKKSGLEKHGEIVSLLKADHEMGHGYANLVAQKHLAAASGAPEASGDDLVAAQYAGAKAALKPIYDAILSAISKFGSDIEVAPKKGYVSLRRSKQFALVQPGTATRLDVGIQLKGKAPAGRLESSGSWNTMVTHRVKVSTVAEVDKELVSYLKDAYSAS